MTSQITNADICHLPPSPQTGQPWETISVRDHAFCLWNIAVVVNGSIECNLSNGHTVVVLQPLRARKNIRISAENIFILNDVTAEQGTIHLRTAKRCAVFGEKLICREAPCCEGGMEPIIYVGESDKRFAQSLQGRLSDTLKAATVNKKQALIELTRLAFYQTPLVHHLPDSPQPPPETEPEEEVTFPHRLKRARVGG